MASLDMSLDDMIKNRRSSQRGRGQGRARRGGRGPGGSFRGGRNSGAPRRAPLGVNTRPSAFTIAKSIRRTKNLPWQNNLLEDSLKAAGLPGLDSGTKLYVSNLGVGVSNEDIRELFSEMGELIRYAIHYDKDGRPSGSAEVIFARRSDSVKAFRRYNNVQLDGRPMKIEIVGINAQLPVSARVNVGGPNGRRRTVVMGQGADRNRGPIAATRGGGFRNRNRGSFRGGRGRGRGGGGRGAGGRGAGGRGWKKGGVEKSAEELDKELENYHAEAMQS